MQRSFLRHWQTLLVLFAIMGILTSSFRVARASHPALADPPADQVAVKPRPGVAINTLLARYNASLLGIVTETNLYFLKLNNGQTASQLLPTLNADPDLFYAEPNYYVEGAPGGGMIMFGAHMAPAAEMIMFGAHGDLTPTPPGGPDQWAWTKIGLTDAQKISNGHGLIVAVLDTGLAADHPLLNSSIAAGYDFVGMTNNIYDTGNGLDDDSDGLVDEDLGHGTHVSGIIVTEAPGVQVMPIRVLNSDGVGTYWEVAAGIRYAVDHGAKIINMSMSAPRLTPSLSDALAYAATHGVLVVAASGTGVGPNYPAAYSDRLTVLGVGATDRNDSVAWFSGGQVVDTDIFAPGVDIYSAYPYNGYVMGTGTSMSAPMVAAEAALLMARYPDWTSAQVIQRILTKIAPVSGTSVGRINLAAALNTGMALDYAVGDSGSPNDNNIKPRMRLVNNTPENIPLSELKIRYWYTIDSSQPQILYCDYTSLGCANLVGSFTSIPASSPTRTATSDTYLEISFSPNAGSLAGGGQADMYIRLTKYDWSSYTEANDYSYDATKSAFTRWDHITVYRNGALVWGTEPGSGAATATSTAAIPGSSPTRTSTPAAATATRTNAPAASSTPTRSSTPVAATATRTLTAAAPTWTSTRTNTPAAPPATATRTPTQTVGASPTRTNTPGGASNTPLPATNAPTRTPAPASTATRTSVPAASLKLQYMAGNALASTQAIVPYLILFNTGVSTIPLTEVRIRYWFTVDGDRPQNYSCDYLFLGCANLTNQFVSLAVPRPGADYYLELGFTSAAGSLAPGANTGPLQSRFSKNDWSFYTQTGDYSFDASKTQYSDWTKVTVYRNGVLLWGIEP